MTRYASSHEVRRTSIPYSPVMKKYIISLVLVLATGANAQSFQFETGLSYVHPTGGHFRFIFPYTFKEDGNVWAPYVGLRTWLSSMIALRLAYQATATLEATATLVPLRPGEVRPAVLTPSVYRTRDKIDVVTFGPQFYFKLAPSLRLVLSPEASWVNDRGTAQYTYPNNSGSGTYSYSKNKVTFGGSVSLNYAIDAHWSIESGYRLVDADPSWNRKLHLFSGGMLYKF